MHSASPSRLHQDDAAAAPSARAATRVARLGLALTLAWAAWQAFSFWHYVNDDAYITFRYSRFLATGRGPYYNPGEHVEGYSNLLLLLLLAPVFWLGGEGALPVAAKVLGVASLLAGATLAFAITRAFVRRIADPWIAAVAAVVAAGLVAVSASCALNAASGLETLLFAALLALGAALGSSAVGAGRWRGAGLAFAAATWTRPEGIAVCAVFWAAAAAVAWPDLRLARRDPAPPGQSGGPAGAAVRHLVLDGTLVATAFAAQLLFRVIAYDGEWLPNTYHAKAGGFWQLTAADYVAQHVGEFTLGWPGLAAGAAGWLLARGVRRASLPLLAAAAAGVLLPLVTGPDWMLGGRMIVPFLPLLGVVLAIGWARLLQAVLRRPPRVALALLATLPASHVCQHEVRAEWDGHTRLRARGYATGHAALAHCLRELAQDGDPVALMDIGIVGYVCDRQRILDLTGLTDRHIGKSPGGFLRKVYDPAYVLDRRPRYVVLVVGAPGDPDRPIPPGTALGVATPMEARLAGHRDFARLYHERRPQPEGGDWLAGVAAQIGAYRVFAHAHPGSYYLLALYRRQE